MASCSTRYSYDPYGNITSSTGTVSNPWKFGGAYGAYTDVSTGLVKIGQRYYDPSLGRWTQPDPLGVGNRYAYASCNPVNSIDPSGLIPVEGNCGVSDIIVTAAQPDVSRFTIVLSSHFPIVAINWTITWTNHSTGARGALRGTTGSASGPIWVRGDLFADTRPGVVSAMLSGTVVVMGPPFICSIMNPVGGGRI